MSKVNGEIEVDRGKLIWELLASPCLEHGGQEERQHERTRKKIKRTLGGNWWVRVVQLQRLR